MEMRERSQFLSSRLAAVRRDHILDAATRVFADKGYNGATVREVAREAGLADGTLYNYFDNKEALLFGILDRLNETEQRQQDLAVPPDMHPADVMRAYVHHRFTVLARVGFPAFRVLISELLVNTRLRERYVSEVLQPTFAIADAAAQSLGNQTDAPARDPRLLVRAQAALVLGCLVLQLAGEPLLAERWEEVPDVVADMILATNGVRHATNVRS